jgi:hypothetical protein
MNEIGAMMTGDPFLCLLSNTTPEKDIPNLVNGSKGQA